MWMALVCGSRLMRMTLVALSMMMTMLRHLVILELDIGNVLVLAHDLAELLAVFLLEGLHLGTTSLGLLSYSRIAVMLSYDLGLLTWLWMSRHYALLTMLWVGGLGVMLTLVMLLGLRMEGCHLVLLTLLQCLDLLNLLGRETHGLDQLHIYYWIVMWAMLSLYLMVNYWSRSLLIMLSERGGGGECDADNCGKNLLHNVVLFNG